MKFKLNKQRKELTISFSKSLLDEQVTNTCIAVFGASLVIGIFWFAPEQLGWM